MIPNTHGAFNLAAFILFQYASYSSYVLAQTPPSQDPKNYLAHLAAANSCLRLNETTDAKRWLDEIPREARGWEWNLLKARSDSSIRSMQTVSWTPVRIDLSQDGKRLAAAGSDGFVRIYQADTFELEKEWKVSEQTLYAVRFHPLGKQIAVCARDGSLSAWDIETGNNVWSQKSGGEGLADIVYRPDGQQLLFCSWYRGPNSVVGVVSTWDAQSGQQTWKTDFGVKPIVVARYSPDGKRFAVGTWDAKVGVWSEKELGQPQELNFADRIQYSAIDDIAFSPDGGKIAAATKSGTPRVWTLDSTDEPVDFFGHSNAVFSVAFSGDGRWLLSGGSDGVLTVWNIERRIPVHRYYGHGSRIASMVVDSRSQSIITASADNSIRQWDLNQPNSFEASEASQFVYGMVVSEQGKVLVTSGQSPTNVTVWDTTNRKCIRHFPGVSGSVNFLDGDGRDWVVGGNWSGDIVLWNIRTGDVVKQMGSSELGGIQQCALSDDRKWVAASTNKKQVVVWNAESGEVAKTLAFPAGCWGLDFSKDSTALVVGDGQGTVHWLVADDWQEKWTCSAANHQINALQVSPNGDWVATGSEGGLLTIIDVAQRQIRHQIQAHSERIWTLDIAPNGERIATGSSDRKVKTWEPVSGVSLLTLADFAEAIYNLRFSPDGEVLYANSLGSQVHVLSVQSASSIE